MKSGIGGRRAPIFGAHGLLRCPRLPRRGRLPIWLNAAWRWYLCCVGWRERGGMRAMDVMTSEVISVDPDTSVQALAALLSERGISGVPVVDADNRVVGVISEGDLVYRVETGTERRKEARTGRRRSWWLDRIASDRELARDYVKSHGRTVRDVMTRNVVVVDDTTELADIAILLETKRIKRVPVVRDGRLVGIVSRANLVRALATAK